jgi:hypothetical protein
MEGITVVIPEVAPVGYLVAHAIVGLVFGVVMWRSIHLAGKCYGDECKEMQMMGASHVANAIIAGLVMALNVLMASQMSYELFSKTLRNA